MVHQKQFPFRKSQNLVQKNGEILFYFSLESNFSNLNQTLQIIIKYCGLSRQPDSLDSPFNLRIILIFDKWHFRFKLSLENPTLELTNFFKNLRQNHISGENSKPYYQIKNIFGKLICSVRETYKEVTTFCILHCNGFSI